MSAVRRPRAVITGASSGIGMELARLAASKGYDLVIASDEPAIETVAASLREAGGEVVALQADLSTIAGVDDLYALVTSKGRSVDLLMANAGRGLGRAFLDQDTEAWRRVLDTNITGTTYLIQKIGRDMRERKVGRILITGSIAGFMPGTFQAVYNGTKAYLNSFAFALRNELQDSGVTVTCLMPGPTETRFFERADMLDTKVAQDEKDAAADVAAAGFEAMMKGDGDVVSGWKNKIQSAVANVIPASVLAEQHRKMAEPGSAQN